MAAHRIALILASLIAGCSGNVRPITPVAEVDLDRFMGDWYVIAHIPSRPEREAYNAIENYRRADDGKILTRFRYRDGGYDRPVETMHPVGTVKAGTGNAVWGMQFIWPIQAEYVVVYLSPDYSQTIIGRSKRDYAWIMARTPSISEPDYQRHLARLRELGYRLDDLRKVPQTWPEPATP
ncbi:hypothetical protein ASE35_17020 [Lysobacter sp. Root916]|uniref:lipocalin family protein n=1 Tax=Lysobacter sp. Root916 TaxID=1736606 RepID=UPI00070A7E03|nr:lipocalin family protein [Lysobacter sp. Root916]KRD30424.1 hypothetical protein ASE35_17020 [Lysobacter sp. Root916]